MLPSFWEGRSVLITGHTGFKGAWLSLWLAKLGARVTGLALPPDGTPNLHALAGGAHVRTIIGDVRDPAVVAGAIATAAPQIIFHMAAQSLVRRSYRDPVETYATNVMGTVHVLDAARHVPSVDAIVVVTSDKCYENRNWAWGYRETDRMGGHDPYSSSKGCAELVTAAFRTSYFMEAGSRAKVATVRAGNVIGGGDWSEDRLIPDIVRSFERGQPVIIRNPNATRPWQHVLEPLNGYMMLAEQLCGSEGRAAADGWNFGPADEDCRPVSYIVDRLATLWGPSATWHLSDELHPHEAHLLKVDASKAKGLLKWRPRLSLDTALDWTVDWYRGQSAGRKAADIVRAQIDRFESLATGN